MSRSDFNGTRSKTHFTIVVSYKLYFFVYKWQNQIFPYFVRKTFVVWIYSNGRVAKNCFWPCCSNNNTTTSVCKRIFYVPQKCRLIDVHIFVVRNCSFATWTVIYNSFSFVNEPFLVILTEHVPNSSIKIFIHSKSLPRPIA